MRFVPSEHEGVQIAEFDPDEILSRAVESTTPILIQVEADGQPYAVNMAAPRYSVLQRSRVCACCGIIGNRMFLEPYLDEATGSIFHRFSLYAETKYRSDSDSHLVVLTVDHIIPRKEGGPDEMSNYQTLCWPCNMFKDNTGLSLEQIRNNLGLANKIWRGSYAVREAAKALQGRKAAMDKALRTVEHIKMGIEKARLEARPGMLIKMDECLMEAERIREEMATALLEAQVSGVILVEVS